jgi:2-hydroxychromene-2-carboxylate isomerase
VQISRLAVIVVSHNSARWLPACLSSVAERADDLDEEIAQNEAAQKNAGHWGVPLFVFENEPFFGQDRIDHLVWRMRQNGLRERAA